MSPATRTATRSRAKRGDGGKLRQAILEQAERLLVESGSHESVSIRAIAQRCDVTPPAVYLHFVDKETLFREVCARRFVELDQRVEDARKAAADPLDELRTVGMTIVNFGLEYPEAFRLAVSGREGVALPGAFGHVLAAVERAAAAGALDEVDPHPGALVVWTGINGLTSAIIAFPAAEWGDKQALIEHMLDVLIEGLLST